MPATTGQLDAESPGHVARHGTACAGTCRHCGTPRGLVLMWRVFSSIVLPIQKWSSGLPAPGTPRPGQLDLNKQGGKSSEKPLTCQPCLLLT